MSTPASTPPSVPLTQPLVLRAAVHGARLGRAPARTALPQETAARRAHRRIVGNRGPRGGPERRSRRPPARLDPARTLAHPPRADLRRGFPGQRALPAARQNARRPGPAFAAGPSARRPGGVLDGEPKTEMWYLAHAEAGADLYAGLEEPTDRARVSRGRSTKAASAELVHRLPVETGDAIFIPSGRIHAIGAGCLIVEIQQNSDTTLPRLRLEPPRPRRPARARCTSINRCSPRTSTTCAPGFNRRPERLGTIVDCPFFRVEKWTLEGARPALGGHRRPVRDLHGAGRARRIARGLAFNAGRFFPGASA